MKKTVVIAVEYEDEITNAVTPHSPGWNAGRGAYHLLNGLKGVTQVSVLNAVWFKDAMIEARKEMLSVVDTMIGDLEKLELQSSLEEPDAQG